MNVAHLALVTPHRCGLYETARDIAEALRATGLDARLVDPKVAKYGRDRGVPIAGHKWALGADIWVSHSGTVALPLNGTPIVHVIHGRPHSSFVLEATNKAHPVYSMMLRQGQQEAFKAFVTLWPEFAGYWKGIVPDHKMHSAPAPVNLKEWTPDGPSGYGFHGKKGRINVVVSDIWREDVTPYHVIPAFNLFARRHEGAKLHIYALPGKKDTRKALSRLLFPIAKLGALGEAQGHVQGLANVYRAADMLITPHRIATRTVREALACGCQVVMAPGNPYTKYVADPQDIEAFADMMDMAWTDLERNREQRRLINRGSARRQFDPRRTAEVFVRLIRQYGRKTPEVEQDA